MLTILMRLNIVLKTMCSVSCLVLKVKTMCSSRHRLYTDYRGPLSTALANPHSYTVVYTALEPKQQSKVLDYGFTLTVVTT